MPKRHLLYTLALDRPGETGHRNMAKMLVSSLLRTRFSGDIVVFHSSPAPLFYVARAGVREVRMEPPNADPKNIAFVRKSQSSKHAAGALLDTEGYDKVIFVDCDALALRNIDHLLQGDWDFAYYAERGTRMQSDPYREYLTDAELETIDRQGINSGTWAVSAPVLGEMLRRWREVDAIDPKYPGWFREQSAFNRVVLDWGGRLHEWPQEEIALPLCTQNWTEYRDYTKAVIVHAACHEPINFKLRFLWSVYSGNFLWDGQMALLNVMEM